MNVVRAALLAMLAALLGSAPADAKTPAARGTPADAKASTVRGTPADAKAMLPKVAAHVKAVGRKQAFQDFTARRPPFFDRGLYVVCLGKNGAYLAVTAHGGFPTFVGGAISQIKDAAGKDLGQQMWDAGNKGNAGVLHYSVRSLMNYKVEHKFGVFQKVGDDVCGIEGDAS